MTNTPDPAPEDEETVNDAYVAVLTTKVVALLAGFAGLLLTLAADDALLVAAAVELALHGAWPVCALVCAFGLYEAFRLTRATRNWLRDSRRNRAAQAAMTAGEKETSFIDYMAGARGKILSWWMESPRSTTFWTGGVTRLAFLGCAALALDFWLPSWGAALGAFGITALVILLEAFTRSMLLNAADLVTFIDPRRPRNTPEI